MRLLKGELGVDHPDQLMAAIEAGLVEDLRGVGPATAERWTAVLELSPSPTAIPAHQGAGLAAALGRHLELHLGGAVSVAGAVRRMDEWVEGLDLVLATEDPTAARVFLEGTAIGSVEPDPSRDEVVLHLHAGVPATVHLTSPSDAGSALVAATGPPGHVGELFIATSEDAATEAEVYERNGLTWIPPPARGLRPSRAREVVELSDLRGDLHLHSDWSPDGRMSIPELLTDAVGRCYEYVVVTDHTVGLRFGGLDEEALTRQRAEIDELRGRFPSLVVLHGAELNADKEGKLDISDAALSLLDLAVVGIHSHFDLDRAQQTARVLRALEHPAVRVLAHPTGRRIGLRPPIDLDLDAVAGCAVEHGVALEVNGHRDRLDLSASLAAQAAETGALLAANSDAHRTGEIGNVANAVATMQRAGIGPGPVVNALAADDFLRWLRARE
jgi:DNA polymerase (family 10)